MLVLYLNGLYEHAEPVPHGDTLLCAVVQTADRACRRVHVVSRSDRSPKGVRSQNAFNLDLAIHQVLVRDLLYLVTLLGLLHEALAVG